MSNRILPNDERQPTLDDQIAAHNLQENPPLTLQQRAEQFELVCRDAVALEVSRRRSGLPEPQPAPWPESTWQFLAEQTRHARA